jgi:hypothetical protein
MVVDKMRSLILSCILMWGHIILPSVLAGSFIKTPDGFGNVEDLTIGSILIGCADTTLSNVIVTHISKTITDSVVKITTEKGSFKASPKQLFYDPIIQDWIPAELISINTTFLDANLKCYKCIDIKTIVVPLMEVYHISTTTPHNFFVSEQELLTHNAVPQVVIGLAWLFGEGLKFAGLSIGATALGTYVGVELYNKNKQSNATFDFSPQSGACGGYTPDPNDDENNTERVFNKISKTDFFKLMKKHYEYYKDDIYRTKTDAFGKKTKYIKWDYLHNDIEAYTQKGKHLGSINPRTLKFYKPANPRNWIQV